MTSTALSFVHRFEPGTEPEYETHQPRTWRTEREAATGRPSTADRRDRAGD